MGAESQGLPPASDMSLTFRSFLNREFRNPEDLATAPALLDRLSSDLKNSQYRLSGLHASTIAALDAWASNSQSLSSALSSVSLQLQDFSACTASASPDRSVDDLVGQLPVLAAEVARVERVRLYAETALRLEAQVGDLEDAVASIVIGTPRIQLPRKMANSPSPDALLEISRKFSTAMSAVSKIEDVIVQTMKSWPQWKRLLMSVDIRVDNAVASLRPSAIAEYRSRLGTIGWPPPLSAGGEDHKDPTLINPLLKLSGEMKHQFEDSFVSLSTLQALQCRRKARQSTCPKSHGMIQALSHHHELLWAIDEMVAPIGSRAAHHFMKWSEQPELIFGLAYRVAAQHAKSMDLVLQPMLDRVKIPGYSVREEWVSAIVSMVSNHLRTHTLAELIGKLSQDPNHRQSSSLYLHIVDLAISFDKKMRSIALQSVDSLTNKLDLDVFDSMDANVQPIVKCVSVLAEQKEWLELWAQLEMADAQEKLERELQKESAWSPTFSGANSSALGGESYCHPQAADATMLRMWALVTQCRSLPQPKWQLDFIIHVGGPFINKFIHKMLQRCQEAEAMTALIEEGAVLKVASCLNAANYCEHKLQEWSEDSFFLDLRRLQVSLMEEESDLKVEMPEPEKVLSTVEGCIFDEAISCLEQFRVEWLQKLVSATQRAFDASFQEYQRNKKRWLDDNSFTDKINISPNLVDALAILQSRLTMLKGCLGHMMFVEFWRRLASSLDQLFFNAIVLSGARFSIYGGIQLTKDMEALFQVFRHVCLRPASFFPSLSDTALLLTLPEADLLRLQKALSSANSWRFQEQDDVMVTSLKEYGVRNISPVTAAKVISLRNFPKA